MAFSAPTIKLRYWLLVQLQSTWWRVGKKWEISPSSPTLFQPFSWSRPDHPRPALLPCRADSSVYSIPPVGVCSCGTDRKRKSRQTCKSRQSGSANTESCHLQRGQDTSPLPVQWRLEEIQRWTSGTPWTNLKTGAGPADHYLPPAHRALWSECPSEEDWHFRHFPVWVRTSWRNPRPRPSVLPNLCREMSANMATGCWSDDQAVGLGRKPLPDGWFCGINRTEDMTCTAVDRWRRRDLTKCQEIGFSYLRFKKKKKPSASEGFSPWPAMGALPGLFWKKALKQSKEYFVSGCLKLDKVPGNGFFIP